MSAPPEINPPKGPYGLPIPSHPLLSGKLPLPPPEVFRGNKDPYIAMCMPSAYADACATATKDGRMKEFLNQVANELSGDLGDDEAVAED